MLSWLRCSRELAVEFCDRCRRVCDVGCRATAAQEQALMRALCYGVRV
jgi:hypothetical protein